MTNPGEYSADKINALIPEPRGTAGVILGNIDGALRTLGITVDGFHGQDGRGEYITERSSKFGELNFATRYHADAFDQNSVSKLMVLAGDKIDPAGQMGAFRIISELAQKRPDLMDAKVVQNIQKIIAESPTPPLNKISARDQDKMGVDGLMQASAAQGATNSLEIIFKIKPELASNPVLKHVNATQDSTFSLYDKLGSSPAAATPAPAVEAATPAPERRAPQPMTMKM